MLTCTKPQCHSDAANTTRTAVSCEVVIDGTTGASSVDNNNDVMRITEQ